MYKTLCQVLRKIQKWVWHSFHAQEAQNLQGVAVHGYTDRMRCHFVVRRKKTPGESKSMSTQEVPTMCQAPHQRVHIQHCIFSAKTQ